MDLRMKLKTNQILIKDYEINIRNQKIEGKTLNIIKY